MPKKSKKIRKIFGRSERLSRKTRMLPEILRTFGEPTRLPS